MTEKQTKGLNQLFLDKGYDRVIYGINKHYQATYNAYLHFIIVYLDGSERSVYHLSLNLDLTEAEVQMMANILADNSLPAVVNTFSEPPKDRVQ